ncbi:MAG: hypothetical protein K0R83_1329 [Caulobacter sp.]|jgi:uncharacterized protein YggU (UPF0235/DUF167 family)|nr:hypothetical protein [Caulobacter sp.]
MQTRLAVRLTPRGGADRIDGWGEDAQGRPLLKVRVSAPPVEGEANAALEKLLAKALGLPKSAVAVAAGQTARVKQVQIEGLDADEVRRRLTG